MPDDRQRRPALAAASRAAALPSIIEVAVDSGLLAALDDGPTTAAELAARLGFDPTGVERVLAVLDDLDLVVCDGATWSAVTSAATIARCRQVWTTLPSVLAGAPRPARSDDAASAGAGYAQLVRELPGLYGSAPDVLAAALTAGDDDDALPIERVLDVAAGSAVWSSAVARQRPAATVVALDLPEVIEAAGDLVAAAGLADRYEMVAHDLWTVELEPEFDLVLAGGVCHLHSDERAAALIRRAASWVAPGGRLVVVDPAASPDDDAALHELSLWLRTERGRRRGTSRSRHLVDAGLHHVVEIDLGRDDLTASVGSAPR